MCTARTAAGVDISTDVFERLSLSEAALLPGSEEAHGGVRRFQLTPRLTSHVRHRAKYLDMPVSDAQAFIFTHDGQDGARAHSLKELVAQLATLPTAQLAGHLQRHDFSRWIEQVFRDCPLATHLLTLENRVGTKGARSAGNDVAQAIRARYEIRAA